MSRRLQWRQQIARLFNISEPMAPARRKQRLISYNCSRSKSENDHQCNAWRFKNLKTFRNATNDPYILRGCIDYNPSSAALYARPTGNDVPFNSTDSAVYASILDWETMNER